MRTSCSIDHWFPTNHAPMSASLSGQSWAVTTLTWVTAWSIIVSLHLIYSSICSCSWCSCASFEGPGVYEFNSHFCNYALQKKNYHPIYFNNNYISKAHISSYSIVKQAVITCSFFFSFSSPFSTKNARVISNVLVVLYLYFNCFDSLLSFDSRKWKDGKQLFK